MNASSGVSIEELRYGKYYIPYHDKRFSYGKFTELSRIFRVGETMVIASGILTDSSYVIFDGEKCWKISWDRTIAQSYITAADMMCVIEQELKRYTVAEKTPDLIRTIIHSVLL